MIVDRLTKSAHFAHVMSTYSVEDCERIFIDDIMCRHDILLSIILNRGAQFTSRFWGSFQKNLGTKVKSSTSFHPETEGQAERTILTLEDIHWACIIDVKGNWNKHFPWWSFLTTIVSIHPYLLLLLKPCMVGGVRLLLHCLKWVSL